ncbi:Siderophore synthetase component [Actinokineospora alba]|uniref:Siderophore synthetase component n=1 Tax=Actinokineospora alba TaxID=504798 RepID=A0A1H0HRD8_9PSEU|nr:IucA/IucC family protein [Actinokineospora alba]TDP64778.1 siderophore synthetase component [Actinokineospora alba]SDH45768.1 Siderophore synthetase component [Actinokineospora alba]SDO21765.1 Siderophore synthetase component [Actinokineospora alba]
MTVEAELLRRVVDALLREDHLGLAERGALGDRPAGQDWAGPWWCAPLPRERRVHLPVEPDGFLAEYRLARPLVVVAGQVLDTLAEVLAALAPADDPEAEQGWADFVEECAQTLAVVRLHETARGELYAKIRAEPGAEGFRELLHHESLAALRDHPVHPTGRCRWGLDEADLRRYAPEFLPELKVGWTTVPRDSVRLSPTLAARLPDWWPEAAVGHLAVPVHPLTGNVDGSLLATPTLSTRTVALADHPGVHLKLPMPTATLGKRNSRTIKPGTLADGDTVHRLLRAILDREPALRERILLADESAWLDSADDLLAVLVRRYPADLEDDTLAPVAALLAEDPATPGGTLLDAFAARHTGGDTDAWLDTYLTLLLDWHVALWVRYGVALEAHQQNITVAMADRDPWLRLVYKDDDGARIDCERLSEALGLPVTPDSFADQRMCVTGEDDLADLFITITLHLCAGALIVEHAGDDLARRARLFALLRNRIEQALVRWTVLADPRSVAAAEAVRRRVLEAEHLPVKAMVTAGTLLPKHRLGCTDINKHYRHAGPNYLRPRS